MSEEFSLEEFEGNLVATLEEAEGQTRSDSTFRAALVGDWSGRENRGLHSTGAELSSWRARFVDRDNLDETIAKLGPGLNLKRGNSTIRLDFNKLDDFHPDLVYERAELFQALRELRIRLNDPSTFSDAARDVRAQLNIPSSPDLPTPPETEPPPPPPDGSLLDQIIGSGTQPPTRAVSPSEYISPDLRSLVQEIVRPYLLPDDSEQEALVAAVDKAISEEMRGVLHHPDFQALEASWRALDFLVNHLDTGSDLKLYIIDISRVELESALLEVATAEESGIYELLVEAATKTFGGEAWSLLVANYTFDYRAEDAEVLQRMARVAAAGGTAFIAGAASRLVGCESIVATPQARDWRYQPEDPVLEAWTKLRSSKEAQHVGLALPRFLLRYPYGRDTEPTEKFDFEEFISADNNHEEYLWANPAFAVCYLIAASFSESGWDFQPGELQEISGLPLHIYEHEGESTIKPCAEVLMTVDTAQRIIEAGVMPLISMKGTDAVRLGLFQSIASPARRLAGSWAG